MDLDEILARGGVLTDEEMKFVERELVKAARELHALMAGLESALAEEDPQLAARLRRSVGSMLENVEKAASLPWPDGSPGALAD